MPPCGLAFLFFCFRRYLIRFMVFSLGFAAGIGKVWTTSRLSLVEYLFLSIFIHWP